MGHVNTSIGKIMDDSKHVGGEEKHIILGNKFAGRGEKRGISGL
jgi:hypothetical protein